MFKTLLVSLMHGQTTGTFATEREAISFVSMHWRYASDHGSVSGLVHARVIRPDGSIAFWRQS
jgi:hypothetical protein